MEYAARLLEWFDLNQREMPWRKTKDPYSIWVSETMLQQTQVQTVIPYYNRFMENFKTVEELAQADLEKVYTYWQGLGYYRRALNLHKGAKMVSEVYQGVFPANPKEALKIPGVGPYTLGAVLSIAYNMPVPAVDGNVMRVLSRQFLIDVDITIAKHRKIFEEKVLELMPEKAGDFNQALMELGATVCTPKNPACDKCPMSSICLGYKTLTMLEFPIKSPKKKKEEELYNVLLIIKDGQLWLEKREEEGLLANMWGLPMLSEEQSRLFKKVIDYSKPLNAVKHVFTHKVWKMTPRILIINDKSSDYMEELSLLQSGIVKGTYVSYNQLENLPIATAFKKVIEKGNFT